MSVSFDTLSFAKRLTEAGEKPAVAEAHAMALKEFVMDAIATKADIQALGRSLGEEIQDVRDEVADGRTEIRDAFAKVRGTKGESLLHKDIDAMVSKLTLRWAGMLVVAVGAVATLGKVI
jgi:hypothetical protein